MREIKFRCMELDSVVGIRWIYGYYTQVNGVDYDNLPCVRHYIYNQDGERFEAAESTLGQFTGLQDKNGVDIYEGDIVEFDADEWGDDSSNKHEVTWISSDVSFCFGGGLNHENEYRTVIGNIYENPEILK